MNIESINNAKVKEWVKYKEKKYRDLHGEFIIEGAHLINEALINGKVKEIIAISDEYKKDNIPFYKVNYKIIKKISSQVSPPKVIAVAKKVKTRKIKGNVCLLDDIQDPGNLGAIIRSSVAFNVDTIILSNNSVDLYNEKVIRASEGLIFKMNFIRGNLLKEIEKLEKAGYIIYGTDVEKGLDLKKIKFNGKIGLVIGNEGSGISLELKNKITDNIHIPLVNCESLNASVATSIILYEIYNS